MRLPNGFGSVYKLSGKRRKPFCARKTTGWSFDEEKGKSYPIYEYIGYYETRKEALIALNDYNKDPYNLDNANITFEEVYNKWSEIHFPKVSKSNIKGYKASFKLCEPIHKMKLSEIKLDTLQKIVNESGKNTPTLKKLKILLGLTWDYAVVHEITTKDKRDMIRYLDVMNAGNPNKIDRKPFTKEELKLMWKMVNSNEILEVVLMLIYTGCRVGELLDLKKEDVHLEERWFYVKESKTKAGIREVPIAEKIVPFFKKWMQKDSEFLVCNRFNKHFTYVNFYNTYWKGVMDSLGSSFTTHRPHDTRHTCVSMLTSAGVDERIIKKIVGHKGEGVTEAVYTHLELSTKLEAINKI